MIVGLTEKPAAAFVHCPQRREWHSSIFSISDSDRFEKQATEGAGLHSSLPIVFSESDWSAGIMQKNRSCTGNPDAFGWDVFNQDTQGAAMVL